MKKKVLLISLMSLLLTGCGGNLIKEADFKEGIENFVVSEQNNNDYKVTLEDNMMNIKYEDKKYEVKYDFNGEIKFSYDLVIEKGISYEEYLSKIDTFSLPMIGYIATLDTYGVDIKDSYPFFSYKFLNAILDYYQNDPMYIVLDDPNGVETDAKIIETKDFGDKVISFVKESFKEDIKIKDDDYGTFEYEIDLYCKKDKCIFDIDLTIDHKAKFDKVKGYYEKSAKESMYQDITKENADVNIKLNVGQTAIFKGKKVTGYELIGMKVVDVNPDYKFKATAVGISNGYLYIGDEDIRTVYITVSEAKDKQEKEITYNIK